MYVCRCVSISPFGLISRFDRSISATSRAARGAVRSPTLIPWSIFAYSSAILDSSVSISLVSRCLRLTSSFHPWCFDEDVVLYSSYSTSIAIFLEATVDRARVFGERFPGVFGSKKNATLERAYERADGGRAAWTLGFRAGRGERRTCVEKARIRRRGFGAMTRAMRERGSNTLSWRGSEMRVDRTRRAFSSTNREW